MSILNNELPLLYYGAGRAAEFKIKSEGGICFVDRDVSKHGKTHSGLPVLSLDEAKKRYGVNVGSD